MTSDPAQSASVADNFLRQRRFGRECALQFLYQEDQRGQALTGGDDERCFWRRVEEQEDAPFGNDLKRARTYAEKIVRLYRENAEQIDRELSGLARNWSLDRMAAIDRNILRVAAVEIRHFDNVPAPAAINEALEIAKRYGDKESVSFINGLLDRFAKSPTSTTENAS